jgi:voltage-gated potassium channel
MMRLGGDYFLPVSERIVRGLVILLIILFIGTAGYIFIEGWELLDALYMTVITITTVGFGEVRALSPRGKIFTILVIFSGVGIIAYILAMVSQAMVDIQVRSIIGRTKLGLRMRSLKDHYIICGFGRIGKIIARELKSNDIPIVVIEHNRERAVLMEHENIPHITDDATSEDALIEAGITKAKGLVSVVASDADNLFITMSARGLNSELFILARADEEQTEKKLLRAGANRVFMPYLIGGQKMAQTIMKPAVTDFLDFTVHNRKIGLEMGELEVREGSRLVGCSLIDSGIRQEMDVIIVAIQKKAGAMEFNPSFKTRIEQGDTLIALGKSHDLGKLATVLSGKG